jgi:hypothetical protein
MHSLGGARQERLQGVLLDRMRPLAGHFEPALKLLNPGLPVEARALAGLDSAEPILCIQHIRYLYQGAGQPQKA